MSARIVAVRRENGAGEELIWAALERLVHIRFCFDADSAEFAAADAFVVRSVAELSGVPLGKPYLVVPSGDASLAVQHSQQLCVEFADEPVIDARLRGRRLSHNPFPTGAPLPLESHDLLLASAGDRPAWVRRRRGETWGDIVSSPLPSLGPDERAFDYLNGGHFMQLLPLLHFLREVAGGTDWRPPELRACMMFDDPNLHWSSYGFLPFAGIVELAKRANFHVACATVPLDSWYAHGPTASLLRDHPGQLSLLIHGNDHLRGELGLEYSEDEAQRLLAQALRRIEGLEKRSGVRVSRVMAPPHGACRPAMLRSMSRLGYTGACISPWSLRDWAPGREWPPSFGLEPAEVMDEHFAVAPRFKMYEGCEGWVVISAFLNRPIIPVGHHDTLSAGLDLLTMIAEKVNSLGKVAWGDLESVFAGSAMTRQDGSQLHLRPYSSAFQLTIPPGASSLVLAKPSNGGAAKWTVSSVTSGKIENPDGEEFPVNARDQITGHLLNRGSVSATSVPPPKRAIWAPVRRVLCEGRDRMKPMLR